MAVRYLKTRDDETYPFARECFTKRAADTMGDRHEMGNKFVREVGPLIDLAAWHDEAVAGRNGIDRHEQNAFVVAVRDVTGKLAIHDAGKDAGH